MAYVGTCNCCVTQAATRMCLSCDPKGEAVIYMCNKCSERAHFGPMKLSHHVKSLVNIASKEHLLESHKDWSEQRKRLVTECVQELKAYDNDLEQQKRLDLDIMSAAFEPLKNAVINRKRELTAQIVSHYDNMKPSLTEATIACEQRMMDIESTHAEISQLDDTWEEEEFGHVVETVKSQMTEFKSFAIRELLPQYGDGHCVVFPPNFDIDATTRQIQKFQLKTTPSYLSADQINSITLTSGDIVDVVSESMDTDGIFWLRRHVTPEMMTPLCRLSIKCRQDLIAGEIKRYNEHPHDLHSGMIVMANLPGDDVWRRAVIADPCVKDKPDQYGSMASVVVLDSGIRRNLYHSRLTAYVGDTLNVPFLSFPCSLYPEDHDSLGVEPRWLYNDLIKDDKGKAKTFKAKFVHKKNPQYSIVPVWYVQLTDAKNSDISINHMIEEKRLAGCISKGAIQHKDIRVATGQVAPSAIQLCSIKDSTPDDTAVSDRSGESGHDGAKDQENKSTQSLFDGYQPPHSSHNESSLPPTKISVEENSGTDSSITSVTIDSAANSSPQCDQVTSSPPADIATSVQPSPSLLCSPSAEVGVVHSTLSQPSINESPPQPIDLSPGSANLHQLSSTVIADSNSAQIPNDLSSTTTEDFYCSDSTVSVDHNSALVNDSNTDGPEIVDGVVATVVGDLLPSPTADGAELKPNDMASSNEELYPGAEAIDEVAEGATNCEETACNGMEVNANGAECTSYGAGVMSSGAEATANSCHAVASETEAVICEGEGYRDMESGDSVEHRVDQCESPNSSIVPPQSQTYEEWQEPSRPLPLYSRSDDQVFTKPKRKSKKRFQHKSGETNSNLDTLSDPETGQHSRPSWRRGESPARSHSGETNGTGRNRPPTVMAKSTIRSWISSTGRTGGTTLPALTSIPGDYIRSVNQASTADAGSSQVGDGSVTTLDVSTALLPTPPGAMPDPAPTGDTSNMDTPNQPAFLNAHPREGMRGGRLSACYRCGSTNHQKRNCPKMASAPKDGLVCTLCTGQHGAENCPRARKWYNDGGCPYCLTLDHKRNNCPRARVSGHIAFNFMPKKFYGRKGNNWH